MHKKRSKKTRVAMTPTGNHTHKNSLNSASNPPYLTKFPSPMGDTSITCHGKKYRVVSNGEKKWFGSPSRNKSIRSET